MNNEEKILSLMEKMYTDFTKKFKEVNAKLDQKADKTDIVRMENELEAKSKALFDGYNQNYEAIQELRKEVKLLGQRVDKQEIQLKIVK